MPPTTVIRPLLLLYITQSTGELLNGSSDNLMIIGCLLTSEPVRDSLRSDFEKFENAPEILLITPFSLVIRFAEEPLNVGIYT